MKQAISYHLKANATGSTEVTHKIITPFNSKRIGRVYCEPISNESTLFDPIDSFISLSVNSIQVLNEYPITWICPKYYSKKLAVLNGFPTFNNGFSVDIDEPALGNEIEITVRLIDVLRIVVIIEYDDLPIKPNRIRRIVDLNQDTVNGMIGGSTLINLGERNIGKKLYTLDVPAVGLFAEIFIRNYAVNDSLRRFDLYDQSGKIGKDWDVFTYNYQKQPSVVSFSENTDINPLANNIITDEHKLREVFGNALLTINDGKQDLLRDVQLRLIAVDNNISPKEAFFPLTTTEKSYAVTIKYPSFITHDPENSFKQNNFPADTIICRFCFLCHEPR